MVTKRKTLSSANDNQLAETVRSSAQQIWQAGLGAFAKAQEGEGKVFAKLVKEGTALQKRTQTLPDGKVAGIADTVSRIADSAGKQASGSWDKLEQVFEDRVARSLTSLGVPTREEIQALARCIEELNDTVAALAGRNAPAAKTENAKKTPAKTPAKAASAKRTGAGAAAKKAAPQRSTARGATTKSAVRKAGTKTGTADR
jgi:poly(hydroxyalkanoate) granule-associated protein